MAKVKNVSRIISSLMTLKNKSIPLLAKEKDISDQAMRNKLSRANYGVDDLIEYAKFLGVDVGFKDGDNFYSFIEHNESD